MEVQALKTKRLLISLRMYRKHPAQCFVRITKAIKGYYQESYCLEFLMHCDNKKWTHF